MPLLDLFEGLLPASFRGEEFHVLNIGEDAGRRWVRTLFPGRDAPAWEDLGALPGQIVVNALVVGQDYVPRAQALLAAFRAPGPGTLVHPWFGEIEVVLAQSARVDLAERELRLVRIDAVFERYVPPGDAGLDTLGELSAAYGRLRGQLRSYLGVVLAPARLALGVVASVAGMAQRFRATLGGIVGAVRNDSGLVAALVAPFAGLTAIGSLAPVASYAAGVADALAAPPQAIAAAALPAPAPAVTPAAPVAPAAVLAPAEAALLLLQWEATIAGDAALAGAPASLALAARCEAVAAAVEAAARIPFESDQEAAGWRATLDTAIGALADAAAVAAKDDATAAGEVWRALLRLRSAWARDISARIGRLPSVRTLDVPNTLPVLVIAHHLVGDDPARTVASAEDLVRRNRLALPAAVSGTIEHLA